MNEGTGACSDEVRHEYRKYAKECHELAAMLTNPKDKRAVEIMAAAWGGSANEREVEAAKTFH
jgi:hypothetical protein